MPGTKKRKSSTSVPVMRFVAIFAALLGCFYGFVLVPCCDRVFYDYLTANARIANVMLRWLAQDTHVSGVTIRSAQYAISIRRGCDAVDPAWFFCAAVLAFPSRWRRKLAILPVGIALISALNLVRIVSLYFIGLHLPRFFPTAHLELWPVIFIIVVLLLWIAWIRSILAESQPSPNRA